MKIYQLFPQSSSVPVGLLEVDPDPQAERLFVIDRLSMLVVHHQHCRTGKLLKFILPDRYTTTDQLTVLLVDDSGVFNAAVEDRIRLEKVDARTVNLIPE